MVVLDIDKTNMKSLVYALALHVEEAMLNPHTQGQLFPGGDVLEYGIDWDILLHG